MKSKFFGGPYDGLSLDTAEINAFTKVVPTPLLSRTGLALLFPPLENWSEVVSGAKTVDDFDRFYCYERVFTSSGVEFHIHSD